jgi:hypothetical protein
MKRLTIAAIAAVAMLATSCQRIWDVPVVELAQSEYNVSSTGGVMVIPVCSTGIDDVEVSYKWNSDEWETDANGDMTPKEGWCKVVKIIKEYEATRELPVWDSGVQIEIQPNTVSVERTAYITVWSFNQSAVVTITQTAKME